MPEPRVREVGEQAVFRINGTGRPRQVVVVGLAGHSSRYDTRVYGGTLCQYRRLVRRNPEHDHTISAYWGELFDA